MFSCSVQVLKLGVCRSAIANSSCYKCIPPVSLQISNFHSAGRGYEPSWDTLGHTMPLNRKHKNTLFRKERSAKVQPIELVDFHEKTDHLTPQEIRMKMKRMGIYAHRPWNDKPMHLASTPSTFEPYIPPEQDDKLSIASKDGAKQKIELVGKKGKAYMALRKIYSFDEDFDIKEFSLQAQDIYIKAHKALAEERHDDLHELVTERAFPLMTHETKSKTIRWQFLESVEKPRAVHIRYTDVITKENIFAQVTIRMHTKQTLAVYDRFGRLMHGSEVVAKDALEYVVFEKHLSNEYGVWRIHDKIIPNWAPKPPAILKTFRRQPEPVEEEQQQQEAEQ